MLRMETMTPVDDEECAETLDQVYNEDLNATYSALEQLQLTVTHLQEQINQLKQENEHLQQQVKESKKQRNELQLEVCVSQKSFHNVSNIVYNVYLEKKCGTRQVASRELTTEPMTNDETKRNCEASAVKLPHDFFKGKITILLTNWF